MQSIKSGNILQNYFKRMPILLQKAITHKKILTESTDIISSATPAGNKKLQPSVKEYLKSLGYLFD